MLYKVAVSALGENYVIDRRYKEFLELHEHALKNYSQYDFSNFPSSPALLEKHTGIFTSYACPHMIQSRIDAFNSMLAQLSGICSKLPDTAYLEWLQLDQQLIVPL